MHKEMTDSLRRFAACLLLAAIPFALSAKSALRAVADSVEMSAPQAETKLYSARVVSSEKSEALSYVTIFVKSGIGTMTNEDGDFTIKASPEDVLQISYVGFTTLKIKAKDLPKKVVLKPLSLSIENVTVVSTLSILKNVEKRLNKEYSNNKKYYSRYFMRQVTSTKHKELLEAFIEANNAVNLRDITFLSGFHGRQTGNVVGRSLIANMNFHHPFEIAPKINETTYWNNLVTPFYLPKSINLYSGSVDGGKLGDFYEYSHETLFDEQNHKFYKIIFEKKEKVGRAILVGSLFVDAETYEVLNFEGGVEGLYIDVVKDFVRQQAPIELKMNINYRSIRGYTEVDNINYTLKSGNLSNKALIINIDSVEYNKKGKVINEKRKLKKAQKALTNKSNMLDGLSLEGFGEIMEEHADFVKRTTEETDLALGKIITVDDELTNNYCVGGKDSTKVWKLQLPDTPMGNNVNRLAKLGQVIPQEKVYVQMDNTCYFLGDTIWYSTFLRRTSDDLPSNISGVMYVELYNQDGYLMQRQMIDMKNGRGHGCFATNTDWYGGYYELRAYTRWQLNWGAYVREHSEESENWFINEDMEKKYFRDYEKLYRRVFPVYDPPTEKGKYSEIMSTRTLRRYFKNDPDKRKLELRLYPEGGEMVAGVPCRVAFEAVYSDGEYADGVVTVKTEDIVGKQAYKESKKSKTRKEVQETKFTEIAKTQNRGRGVFTFTPTVDKKNQEFIFTSNFNKETAKAKIEDIQNNGVALSLVRNDSIWNIHVQKVGSDMPDSIGLTVMHDSRVRVYQEIYANDSTLVIPDSILEAGVNQITVFDRFGRVFADRLFFVTRPGVGNDNLVINGLKDQYQPYEKISLDIKATANSKSTSSGILSLSVRDMEHADYLHDSGTIMTEMLLSSEVLGFIPNPGWFFESDDAEHRNALDLMMMTQGWRRFKWRDYAIRGEWDLSQPDERTPIITGNIYKYPAHYFYNKDEWSFMVNPFREKYETLEGSMMEPAGETSMDYQVMAELDNEFDSDKMRHTTGTSNSTAKITDADQAIYQHEKLKFTEYSKISDEYQVKNTKIKPSVVVNSELTDLETSQNARVMISADNGRFRLALPRFYNTSIFHLAASDTTKFKRGETTRNHIWVQNMPNDFLSSTYKGKGHKIAYPDFSVRVDFPYPRFVKPYDFYQMRTDLSEGKSFGEKKLSDGSYQLAEVKVRAKHSGYRARTDSMPALVVDAYEAYNYALDAGMRHASPLDILRAYVGDYGVKRPYMNEPIGERGSMKVVKNYNLHIRQGATTFDRMWSGNTLNRDSMYLRRNLESHLREGLMAPDYSDRLENIDVYAIYTDYQPRLIGSNRYSGSNLPKGEIVVYPIPDGAIRKMYRDRCWIFDGISIPYQFYSPDYSKMTLSDPPADYRRTLYWNPELQLDDNGSANIQFFNNGNMNQISVKAEGFTNTGELLQGHE